MYNTTIAKELVIYSISHSQTK